MVSSSPSVEDYGLTNKGSGISVPAGGEDDEHKNETEALTKTSGSGHVGQSSDYQKL